MKKAISIMAACCFVIPALASETRLEIVHTGIDAQTVTRGVDAMMADCHSCHSMKYIKYRDLITLGANKLKVDEWRGDQPLDAPLMAQMSAVDAEQAFGKAPPDLSLMTKARTGGANYVYSYLLGYYTTPDGKAANHFYPGTRMPDILGMSQATGDAQRTDIKTRARDIVSFLNWASDPHEQERHKLGYYVIAYLLVLTALLYLVKKQVWAKLK
ncbi:MAG: cytochrome c1 [Gallionella sp.]|nr:cytochrome c1 [Gallionella sp.]